MGQPSDPTRVVDKDGYHASFYPGFVRVLEVAGPSGRSSLYDQSRDGPLPFNLPPGATEPAVTSVFHLSGGPADRSVTLQITDPRHEIQSIVIRFKDAGAAQSAGGAADAARRGGVAAHQEGETVTLDNTVILCPPHCPEQPPEG